MAQMAKWEQNNIFRSWLAEDVFRSDVLDRITDDYKTCAEHKGKKVTREELEDVLVEMVENIMNGIDWFLDEEFEDEEDDEE